jgi:hypothetical protein
MSQIKFVQTWDMVAGRKQEYAAFITREFLPVMKASGLEVDSGWYTLLGGGPHIMVESLAGSLSQVEGALRHPGAEEMLNRFTNLVAGYSSCVLAPAAWGAREPGKRDSKGGARLLQSWDVLPGDHGTLDRFMEEEYLPGMARIGLEPISGWRLALGTGPQFLLEAIAKDLSSIFNAMGDDRYLRLILKIEELVTRLENRVLVRHESFLEVLYTLYGRAIRAVSPDAMYSMVGPVGE